MKDIHSANFTVVSCRTQQVSYYLLDIEYPVVSNICLPQIEQRPFLYAQPMMD